MPIDLASFGLPQMLRCGRGVRASATGTGSIEDALGAICRYLYNELRAQNGERACALIRCYKTHRFNHLTQEDREFARTLLGGAPPKDGMRCLTLLATVGDESQWNDRRRSKGHRAIPLPSPEIVEKAPMIAQLIKQFGLDLSSVIEPSPEVIRDREGKSYGIFHVEDAAGSPYIPAQDEFVLRYKIRSVVGCGGFLRNELFALILFSRVAVSAEVADRFRTIALDVKASLYRFEANQTFETTPTG